MPTGDYPPTNIYGRPIWPTNEYDYNYKEYGNPFPYWQWIPQPWVNPYVPYQPEPAPIDACPMCGRRYAEFYEYKTPTTDEMDAHLVFDNGSTIGVNGTVFNPDDYVTKVESSEDGVSVSISFIPKPKCWGQYPGGHTECTDDCSVRRECRKKTLPYGKSDDNNLPYGDEEEPPKFYVDEPVDEEVWRSAHVRYPAVADPRDGMEALARSARKMIEEFGVALEEFTAAEIAGAGSWTHEELDQIVEVLKNG